MAKPIVSVGRGWDAIMCVNRGGNHFVRRYIGFGKTLWYYNLPLGEVVHVSQIIVCFNFLLEEVAAQVC